MLRGLRAKTIVNIAVLLLVGMLLIDFVTIISLRSELLRVETSKWSRMLQACADQLSADMADGDSVFAGKTYGTFFQFFPPDDIADAVLLDQNYNLVYSVSSRFEGHQQLKSLTRQSISGNSPSSTFIDTSWALFWLQSRYLALAVPVLHQNQPIGGIGVAIPLQPIDTILRRFQKILLIYIIINATILTFVGVYRLSKVYLEPIQRLVKRAENYKEDDGLFFAVRKEDNELHLLSKSLNLMLERISKDKKRLRSTVSSLERANFDLKQAQREIIQAEKLASVGRLSSGIAHEIGNPIGIIIGYLDLLKQDDITDKEKSEYIRRTEDEINRVNVIIRQLLDLSRPSNDGMETIRVHDVIEEVTDVIKYQSSMNDVRLDLELFAEADSVRADPNQLRQVFLNLLLNSADAISMNTADEDKSGQIMVKSSIEPKPVDMPGDAGTISKVLKLQFCDNGPGIDSEYLANIFDPFFTTKEPGKGTGLGLSVSFMIIESLGGKITAESQPGSGTCMLIYLPLCKEPALTSDAVSEENQVVNNG